MQKINILKRNSNNIKKKLGSKKKVFFFLDSVSFPLIKKRLNFLKLKNFKFYFIFEKEKYFKNRINRFITKEQFYLLSKDNQNRVAKKIDKINPDLGIIFSFGQKIYPIIIKKFRFKIINYHTSILPKYGGANPLFWTIVNNENRTGVSVHYINHMFDSGGLIQQSTFKIKSTDNRKSLSTKLEKITLNLIFKNLTKFSKSKCATKLIENTKIWPRFNKSKEINLNDDEFKIQQFIKALTKPILINEWTYPYYISKMGKLVKFQSVPSIEEIRILKKKHL